MNRLVIWCEGAAQWSHGGGLVCLTGLVLRELRETSGWIKGPLWAADGAGSELKEGKGKEMDRLTKTASTHPHRPSTHMIPQLKKSPQLFGWREVCGEAVYVQLGYSIKV